MIHHKIGSFIAQLRREQNMTQEQLAEKIGVSNRSVSRWENGKTLPDLTLMQCICQITGVTMAELLNGARNSDDTAQRIDPDSIFDLWERERLEKARMLNLRFAFGLLFLLAANLTAGMSGRLFHGMLICFGIVFLGAGFYRNNCDRGLTEAEKAVLAADNGCIAMRSPEELLVFAGKSQDAALNQHKVAFDMICRHLNPEESVHFSMIANECRIGTDQALWHTGIAVTRDRLFVSGEVAVGQLIPRTVVHAFQRDAIRSVQCTVSGILIRTDKTAVSFKGNLPEHVRQTFEQELLAK